MVLNWNSSFSSFFLEALLSDTLKAEDVWLWPRCHFCQVARYTTGRVTVCLLLQVWGRAGGLLLWTRPSGCRTEAPSAAGRSSQSCGRSSGGQYEGSAAPRRQKTPCSPQRGNKLQRQHRVRRVNQTHRFMLKQNGAMLETIQPFSLKVLLDQGWTQLNKKLASIITNQLNKNLSSASANRLNMIN